MRDPIAIIGMGCRFPDANDPHAFWHLLQSGTSAIKEIPPERWNIDQLYDPDLTQPGKITSRWGGFLDQIDQFDWRAFRMLPREAKCIDPQQRLLLEVAWEALEDAGFLLSEIAGSQTGTFIGVGWSDYLRLQSQNWSEINGYTATGNASGFAANRLSYAFDLLGPSMTVDASCTSSLNALYLACQSLWTEEIDLALVGGVSLQISPDHAIMVSKAGLLSPDGRCKTLDISADGFVIGEGAGIIVVKRLSQVRPEERIYALLLNVASSHNGHNEWIMAPSQAAQERLLQRSYRQAHIHPGEIDYVELHGTGFLRGDAVEAQALGAILGSDPERRHPCFIGSVKTNIGHLGAAAGIASTIKVALSLYHQQIPPTLNLQTLNPDLRLQDLRLDVPRTVMPWPEKGTPPLAGVSSFSLSGANAHAVLSAAPRPTAGLQEKDEDEKRLLILPLSAQTATGLQMYAAAFQHFLKQEADHRGSWQNICYTASVKRTHWTHRLAVVGQTIHDIASSLEAFLQRQNVQESAAEGMKPVRSQQCVFLFSHTWPDQLNVPVASLQKEPAFRLMIERCEQLAQIHAGYSLLAELEQAYLTSARQPLTIFALQIAFVELWRSWGIIPDVVLGDGWGKFAAEYTRGAVTLEEATQSIVRAGFVCSQPSTSEEDFLQILLAKDSTLVLEPGPHSALGDTFASTAHQHHCSITRFSSLDSARDSRQVLLETLAGLFTQGMAVNWLALYDTTCQCVSLPCFPWQRERLWVEWLNVDEISTPPEKKMGRLESAAASPKINWSQLPLVEALAKLWADVLGLDRVDQDGDFFALGGHSLLAMQLVARIRTVLHIEIALNTLLSAPTPSTCAAFIVQNKTVKQEAEAPFLPLVKEDTAQRFLPFPTTDIQQAYWVGRSMAPDPLNVGNHGYIEVAAAGLDIQRFNWALQQLIARHAMLRAVMLPDGQQHILEVVPPFEATLIDLQGRDQSEVRVTLQNIRQEMDHQLLPVEKWPAFDIRIVLLDKGQAQIHLSVESIFIDAWSMHLLLREFIHLYHHPDAPLPDLALSFRDYLLTAMQLHNTEAYRLAESYWQERIPSLPPAPDLPLVTKPSLLQPRFVHREGHLEEEVWKQLKTRASRASLTPSGLLLAAFSEVLRTWSKTSRFSLNLSIFNRLPLHPQVNQIVGDFTSLIVLAIEHTAGTFEQRARHIQEQLWRDLDHSMYSGVRVLQELGRRQDNRAIGVMPIVFTSLLIEDMSFPYPTPWQETLYSVSQTPQVWLDHQVLEAGGTLIFHWQVLEALFPGGVIDAMFSAYCQLLRRLALEEETWQTASLSLLPAQQQALYASFNTTDRAQEPRMLHHLFLRQAAQNPDQLAIITPQRRLSYSEVRTGAVLLAYQLRQLGVRPNQLVAVVMEKGWEQVVAVLGILMSGAAYLPIDASTPDERFHYLLAQGNVDIVLTQSFLVARVNWPAHTRYLCVDTLETHPVQLVELEDKQTPEDLAYVIYTSGSTGLPKGVMIDHRGAVNTILDINARFQVGPGDRVLALSALTFDLSAYDIFGLLAAGGTVVIPADEAIRDPLAWLELLVKERVTLWNSVPALLQILIEFAEEQAMPLSNALRLVLLSGDWIPLSLPGRLTHMLPAVEIISLGGATEASIWSIFYPIKDIDPSWKSIPYGRPLQNQHCYVFNELLEPCPLWVTGAIYIGGIGLARGYWGDEEKTQASFFLHPGTGERLYKTGDLGRYLPDGTIEFLGREDFQVKIQGYRIELGEIEATLTAHPDVQEALVIAVGDRHGEKYLIAYGIVRPGSAPSAGELRAFLERRLPGYMVPLTFVPLEEWPLTSNGKIDRKALPLPSQQTIDQQEAPFNETTIVAQIRRILVSILKVEQIDPHKHLLDYGATSLAILRIINQLQSQFHLRLYPEQLHHHATLAGLAWYCEQQMNMQGQASENTGALLTEPAEINEWEEGIL